MRRLGAAFSDLDGDWRGVVSWFTGDSGVGLGGRPSWMVLWKIELSLSLSCLYHLYHLLICHLSVIHLLSINQSINMSIIHLSFLCVYLVDSKCARRQSMGAL